MPRSENQKLKLLYLKELFETQSDEQHILSMQDIVSYLAARGIRAERKSVYDDLSTLNEMPDFPYEIMQKRGRGGGYFPGHPVRRRPFQPHLDDLRRGGGLYSGLCAQAHRQPAALHRHAYRLQRLLLPVFLVCGALRRMAATSSRGEAVVSTEEASS